ncbi:MAG: prepilin-type N-terminal cleavage/methylation domain-containing protein [Candidatus Brocadiales bacterium]|nr:prepilin-type N-terminal cleavage/methylation domain-containing protein [Candidatus Brocadiales bacterium]
MEKRSREVFLLRDQGGFTLIEVIIAMLISSIVLASIYSSFKSQQDSYVAQDQVAEMQQNIRAGFSVMISEIRMAGYDPDALNVAGITVATPNSITFTLVADDDGLDNNADAVIDEPGELKTIKYDLYDAYGDGDNDIGRQVGAVASTKRAIAENIENIEFIYLDSAGAVTAVLNNICTIQISILARSSRPDQDFMNSKQYTTASGTLWGPYNDNYRRRFQVNQVRCRNLGL